MSNERFSVGSYESSHGPGREVLLSELEQLLSSEVYADLLEEIAPQLKGNQEAVCILYPDGSLEVR